MKSIPVSGSSICAIPTGHSPLPPSQFPLTNQEACAVALIKTAAAIFALDTVISNIAPNIYNPVLPTVKLPNNVCVFAGILIPLQLFISYSNRGGYSLKFLLEFFEPNILFLYRLNI